MAGWTRRAVLAALTRANLDVTIAKFASNAARYAVVILGLMSCAPIMGINITAFAAVLGAGGLAVGLASQGALSNGAAGLMLLITRPFKAGDTIVIEGTTGLKLSITVWAETATLLQARDQAITAVRDALAHGKIGGPTQVTTVRLLGSAGSGSPTT